MRLLFTIWLALIGIGLVVLWDYSNKPGLAALAPEFWPSNTSLKHDPKAANLLMFVLPNCPCSKSSLGELNQIIAKTNGKINVKIISVTPEDQEADRFGARTSGQVLLYDKQGKLVFSGGITSARGHFGDSFGKSAIISFINHNHLEHKSTPVFGCALKDYHDNPRTN